METVAIGKYEILELLGQGGMGTVYKARDPRIGRLVAIKKITAGFTEGSDLLKRFLQEAEAVGKLQHPNIVTVYDLGDEEGTPYLVMEFVTGNSLDKLIAARADLALVQKLDVIIQVCHALHYAHQHNIVHRDVKPANVILLPSGQVKLLDFGVAHAADRSLTRTGQILGTLNYISPEQLNGQPVDARSDVFSTGVMLYELLTYVLPFEATGTAALIARILHDPTPPLSNVLHDYPAELDNILERALAKNPNQRYASAEDFAFDLAHVREEVKRDMVDDYLEKARTYVARSELPTAREFLARVLKLDTQHTVARQMMYEVQRLIERKQNSERIQALRQQAEQALSEKRYAEALATLDEALQLDKTDTELLSLRDLVQQKSNREKQVRKLMRLAESAQQAGEFLMAKNAVEDALQLDPADTQANVLQASLVRQIEEMNKKKRIRELLNAVHQEISAKRFTAAYERITEAEALDQEDADVQAVKEVVLAGHKQEQRRKEVESACVEVETLLAEGDVIAACAKADQAAKKFPGEPSLVQLKAIAENKRDAAERNRLIEAQIAEANRLVETGHATEALKIVQRACQRFAGDSRLLSMLGLLRERAQQEKDEQLKRTCLAKANREIESGEYDSALMTLDTAHGQLPRDIEIAELLQNVRTRISQLARERKVDIACKRARQLMADSEYRRAITLLERADAEFSDQRVTDLLQQAREESDKLQETVSAALGQAQRMLQEGKVQETVTFLLTQPPSFARVQAYTEMCDLARREFDRTVSLSQTASGFLSSPQGNQSSATPSAESADLTEQLAYPPISELRAVAEPKALEPLPPPHTSSGAEPQITPAGAAAAAAPAPAKTAEEKRDRTPFYIAIPTALIIVIAVTAILHHKTQVKPGTTPAPEGYVYVLAQPWGTVRNFKTADGKVVEVGESTPLLVRLPAGEYTVTIIGPNNEEQTDRVSVSGNQPVQYQHTFEAVDAKKIVSSY